MIDAECKEIHLQKDYLNNEKVSTIYFGGGTPSLLDKNHLASILDTITSIHDVKEDVEITLEANPDDISDPLLNEWKELGINRLSIGIQSFDDGTLRYMNRVHDSKMAIEAIYKARNNGLQNLNIDLIYGIHAPKHNRWISDLERLDELRPEHISAYCLTIEPNTVFGRWLKKGQLKPVNDDFSAEEFEILTEKLIRLGYIHYEVSNFCLAGKESRHNSGYWKNQKYLGIGPGAHSYDRDYRHFNVSNNALYIKSIENDTLPHNKEQLTREEKINEYLLTSLRTHWGASLQYLMDNFGFNILEHKGEYVRELKNQGYIEIKDDFLILTPAGFLLADKISSDLFA